MLVLKGVLLKLLTLGIGLLGLFFLFGWSFEREPFLLGMANFFFVLALFLGEAYKRLR